MSRSSGLGSISTRLRRIAELSRQLQHAPLTTLAHYIDVAWLREASGRDRPAVEWGGPAIPIFARRGTGPEQARRDGTLSVLPTRLGVGGLCVGGLGVGALCVGGLGVGGSPLGPGVCTPLGFGVRSGLQTVLDAVLDAVLGARIRGRDHTLAVDTAGARSAVTVANTAVVGTTVEAKSCSERPE